MSKLGLHGVLNWLRRSVLADVPCGELLDRFIAHSQDSGVSNEVLGNSKADDAFAELVRRHGPKVYAVCRRILGDHQLAEDAFQATFVVLAKRAHSVRPRFAVGGFLYGVARHAALKASVMSRRRKEKLVSRLPDRPAAPMGSHESDVLPMLDEEIANLSATYRAAVVMCEIDGVSRAEAAKQLGIAEGTLSARLARAREQLRKRLLKRGVTLSAGMVAALAESAHAAVPFGLTAVVANITANALPPAVSLIAHGVLKAMILSKLKTVTMFGAALFLSSGLGFGLFTARDGLAGAQGKANPIDERKAVPAEPNTPKPVQEAKARTDAHGDPVPLGALARLGTLRQRAVDSHVAVSADGKDIITVGPTMTVRVWDAESGLLRSINQLPTVIDNVTMLSPDSKYRLLGNATILSPNGKYLLLESNRPDGRQLVVWDLTHRKIACSLAKSKTSSIEGIAFSADERQIAIPEFNREGGFLSIAIWDLESGQTRTLHEFQKEDSHNYRSTVQFSPDGKKLVAYERGDTMHCWDLTTDRLIWTTQNYSEIFCFTADSKTIVRGQKPLDAATGNQATWKQFPPEHVFPFAVSRDGKYLAFLTSREAILIWDIARDKTVLKVPKADSRLRKNDARFAGHAPTDFAFTPDSKGFVWRSDVLQRWNLPDGNSVFPHAREWGHTGMVRKVVFSPDGKQLASSSQDDFRVLLWDIATARPLFAMASGLSQQLAFTSNGKYLLGHQPSLESWRTVFGKWETVTGKVAAILEPASQNKFWPDYDDRELRVTSDGKKILMLTRTKGTNQFFRSLLTVWDATSGECLRYANVPWGNDSALTPDGESVLAFDRPTRSLVLRSLDKMEPRWYLPIDDPGITDFRHLDCDFELSLDGRLMASRLRFQATASNESVNGNIRICEMETGRQLMKLEVHAPISFAFSPDNILFAVSAPASFAISPDNRLIAVAEGEGVRFWEIASHKQVGFIPAPNRNSISLRESFASAIAFSPDSRTLATGHKDTTILLWDATFGNDAVRLPLSDVARESLWTALAGADAVRAQYAAWSFVDDPKESVEFLKPRVSPITAASEETIQQLLCDLDSDQFKRREAAERQLRALGDRAEPGMRQAPKAKLSLEATRRIETILALIEPPPPYSGERLRVLRAVQILERIETPESRQLLLELSQGTRPTWLKRAAAESLDRKKAR